MALYRAQVIGSGALNCVLRYLGREHGVDPTVFNRAAIRRAPFAVKHLRTLHHIQSQRQFTVGSHAFQFQNVAAVL